MMEKNLEYYLNLPYRVEVRPISDEEGGGFIAWWKVKIRPQRGQLWLNP